MKSPKRPAMAALLALAIPAMIATASAQTLYEETFATPPGPNGTLAQFGWTIGGIVASGGYSGTYNYALNNAATSLPINGQTGVYAGNGVTGLGAFQTDDTATALSGFGDIAFTGSLTFSVFNQLQGGGSSANETVYALIQSGGLWFASASAMPGPVDTGNLMDLESLTLDPSAANWTDVSGVGTGTITLGPAASGDLGTITGAGILFNLNNTSYQTFNYADFTISGTPEPSVLALMGLGGFGLVAACKRRVAK